MSESASTSQPEPLGAEIAPLGSPESLVAFHGQVTLLSWTDGSSAGPKVSFQLDNREALAPFEKAVRRRGKRAGQRYRAILHLLNGDPVDQHPDELMFLGANWSTTRGATITFTTAGEEALGWFKDQRSADTPGVDHGELWYLTLVELTEDEVPLDQVVADKMEKAIAPKRKGGPRSRQVAMRCQETEFQQFVASCTNVSPSLVGPETCDRWVKRTCKVQSKIDFDYDDDAWQRYESKINSPYLKWGTRLGHFR